MAAASYIFKIALRKSKSFLGRSNHFKIKRHLWTCTPSSVTQKNSLQSQFKRHDLQLV